MAVLALFALPACDWPRPEAMLDGANVVLVLVDTLRADHLGCYGYSEPTSPFLDQLASRAVAFENVTSASSQTVPAVVSLWSAVYPTVHGNQFFPQTGSYRVQKRRMQPEIPADIPLLAELFRRRGYRTAAVVTNPWLRQAYGFGRGFDEYHYLSGENDSKWAPASAAAVNELALELMSAWKERRFLFYLHYMDAHFPYVSPERHRAQFVASANRQQPLQKVELVTALYDGAIRGVDDFIRELFAGLEALHLAARLEGVLLDPVYTGKAVAGTRGLAARGDLTGGLLAIGIAEYGELLGWPTRWRDLVRDLRHHPIGEVRLAALDLCFEPR